VQGQFYLKLNRNISAKVVYILAEISEIKQKFNKGVKVVTLTEQRWIIGVFEVANGWIP
jgi:hypothetical protein